MHYLAFDLGGGSGRLMLGTYKDQTLALTKIHQFPNHPIEIHGNLYWDILHIYDELCTGVRKAVSMTEDSIRSIGFDSFCNDFACISQNGTLLSPVRCYRDPRTKRCFKRLKSIMPQEELYRITGNQNALFNTLHQLNAMAAENESWLLDHSDRLIFVSDLFISFLTGQFVTEYTTASVTQMFDIRKNDWSEEILRKFRIRKDLFAPIVMPGTAIGKTTDSWNRQIGTKGFSVAAVCQHDTASAFLASVTPKDSAIISCGTWSLVGVESSSPVITDFGCKTNIANEGSCPGHHRLLKNVMGTWPIQEIVRELSELTYADLENAASHAPHPSVFIDVDNEIFFEPGNMTDRIHAYCKKQYGRSFSGIGEMILSIYESLSFKYRKAIEELEQLTQRPIPCINMIGGGVSSALMCQITANICKRPVVAGPADAAVYGNLLMQLTADGQIASVEEGRKLIRNCISTQEYTPDTDPIWETDYQNFLTKLRRIL
ncbi:MAG: rhamnulokinase [Eubacterium sp.]|nr:rhamnulokinase [Eubacterium sp.]